MTLTLRDLSMFMWAARHRQSGFLAINSEKSGCKATLPDDDMGKIVDARYREVSWLRKPTFDQIYSHYLGYFWRIERLLLPIELPDGYGFASFMKIEHVERGANYWDNPVPSTDRDG